MVAAVKVIIDPAVGDFYGTGIEIWARFGLVGITEKKIFGPVMGQFLWSKKSNKSIVVSALYSCTK